MLKLEANLDEYKKKAMAGGDPMATITVRARVPKGKQSMELDELLGQPVIITFQGRQIGLFDSLEAVSEEEEEPVGTFAATDPVA